MRVLPIEHLSEGGIRNTFKDRSWLPLAIVSVAMAACAGYVILVNGASIKAIPAIFPGGLALLMLVLAAARLRLCRKPGNWLLKVAEDSLYVNLRSYRNAHLPHAGHKILHIPKDEVAAMRQAHETHRFPKRWAGWAHREFCYIDIVLKDIDTNPLAQALHEERRLAARRKTHSYPVRLLDPPCVRLVWDWIRPGEEDAAKTLAETYPTAPEERTTQARWESLDDAEKEARMADLWETGYLAEAIRLAQKHYVIGPSAARRRFEDAE